MIQSPSENQLSIMVRCCCTVLLVRKLLCFCLVGVVPLIAAPKHFRPRVLFTAVCLRVVLYGTTVSTVSALLAGEGMDRCDLPQRALADSARQQGHPVCVATSRRCLVTLPLGTRVLSPLFVLRQTWCNHMRSRARLKKTGTTVPACKSAPCFIRELSIIICS